MKYLVLASFRADYKRLSRDEQAAFQSTLKDFAQACDRYAADSSTAWPASLRVRDLQNAPGVLEMTWSFSGPDGRATFEWVQIEGRLGLRWRRIGDHAIFKEP
ncbi:MAG TPA: hypothetical protein VF375_00595 [Candidatus Limnocylindrales bacterium]